IYNDVFCPGNDETFAFIEDVLSEIVELFPSPWIHIGGDEANCRAWTHSEELQTQMRELGLKNEAELHSWFIRQMDGFLTQHGRRMIGWDEILQGGLASGAIVMSWRGMEGGIAAAQAGHDVIMTPASHTYFDYYQGPVASEPKAWGTILPWEKVLEFEPIPDDLRAAQARHVLGGQGQLWGELISTTRHREYMAWPRSAALAEVLWSPKTENRLESFRTRVIEHLKRFNAADITYRPLQPGDVGTRSLSR
ncbi:MAG: family 20 glycosylhydrolase, partial [Sedimentisphaerales bacterium]|nr:family 20 glycosylhydrolase [Sedimentisphaerales bacterium]